jgi:hypothetical protein
MLSPFLPAEWRILRREGRTQNGLGRTATPPLNAIPQEPDSDRTRPSLGESCAALTLTVALQTFVRTSATYDEADAVSMAH